MADRHMRARQGGGRHQGPWVGDGEPLECPKKGNNRTRRAFRKVKPTASTGVGVGEGMMTDEQSVGSKVVLGANTLTGGLKMKCMKTLQWPRDMVFCPSILQKMAGWHSSLSITFAFFLIPCPQPQEDNNWDLVR